MIARYSLQCGDLQYQRSICSRVAVNAVSMLLLLILIGASQALAQPLTVPMQSRPRPNELDTADQGGQAGGDQTGRGYRLQDLRCGTGEAVVGLRIRRGDVLDFVQVGCGTPVCTNRGCSWGGNINWEMSAGNPNGGDPHPDMICNANQMVSGFRGRVVTFGVPTESLPNANVQRLPNSIAFDYSADLEIRCSRIIAPGPAPGTFAVSQFGATWHHPEGGLGLGGISGNWSRWGYIPPNVVSNVDTPMISCANGLGTTALSVGEADFVVSRVVQAVSMYCPRGQPGPRCPDNLIVLGTDDQYPRFQSEWFPHGGRTGGGAVIEMATLPGSANWNGTQIVENVQLQNSTCNINGLNPQNVCGMGQRLNFQVGASVSLQLNNFMRFDWPLGGGQANNGFPDFHFVSDNRNGTSAGVNMLNGAAPCSIVCAQNYTCGNRTYGPFTITFIFSSDSFQRPNDVTRVTVTKR